MKLWTIVPEAAWRVLNRLGSLRAAEHVSDREHVQAYEWMSLQMIERLGHTSMGSRLPIWAWYQYRDAERKRPDLRSSGHLPRGSVGYRIEFNMADHEVLLSDFDTWHYVLNYWHLPASKADHTTFQSRYGSGVHYSWDDQPSLKSVRKVIQQSWMRIFNLGWHDPFINQPRHQKQIQACIQQLCLDDVVRADRFIAR